MGLDMYATAFTPTASQPATDFALGKTDPEIFYWRKHPNLHGWMEQLYIRRGGTNPDFNCSTLLLTSEDIDALEAALDAKALPFTEGFFFGESTPEDEEDDRRFIAIARETLAAGNAVAYHAWW
jgi:hypothetical protein